MSKDAPESAEYSITSKTLKVYGMFNEFEVSDATAFSIKKSILKH